MITAIESNYGETRSGDCGENGLSSSIINKKRWEEKKEQ